MLLHIIKKDPNIDNDDNNTSTVIEDTISKLFNYNAYYLYSEFSSNESEIYNNADEDVSNP